MSKLIADIGATNARFATVEEGAVISVDVLPCDNYASLADAALAYLAKTGVKPTIGAFAVATALGGGDMVSMTNHLWQFSISETRRAIGLHDLKVINDFAAIARATPLLTANDYIQVGGGRVAREMPIGVIGPGTGLGVAGIVFTNGKPVFITTEGGHVTMPAQTAREFALFDFLKRTKYHHVSAERVVSGKGLVNVYNAIRGVDNVTLPDRTAAEITDAALQKKCKACEETLDLFCHFLGVAAGNLALTLGAFGGIYIAGGIVPRLNGYFQSSRFRESFVAKGRFRDYLDRISTFVITHPYPGLEGLKTL